MSSEPFNLAEACWLLLCKCLQSSAKFRGNNFLEWQVDSARIQSVINPPLIWGISLNYQLPRSDKVRLRLGRSLEHDQPMRLFSITFQSKGQECNLFSVFEDAKSCLLSYKVNWIPNEVYFLCKRTNFFFLLCVTMMLGTQALKRAKTKATFQVQLFCFMCKSACSLPLDRPRIKGMAAGMLRKLCVSWDHPSRPQHHWNMQCSVQQGRPAARCWLFSSWGSTALCSH